MTDNQATNALQNHELWSTISDQDQALIRGGNNNALGFRRQPDEGNSFADGDEDSMIWTIIEDELE